MPVQCWMNKTLKPKLQSLQLLLLYIDRETDMETLYKVNFVCVKVC